MSRDSTALVRLAAAGAILVLAAPLAALPPADLLLPQSTSAYFATDDLDGLFSQIEETQWGRLWNDPRMEPFADHLRDHPHALWANAEQNAGTTLAELRQVATGQSALAVVELAPGEFATIFLSVVAGNEPQAEALIARAAARLRAPARSSAGTALRVFDRPAPDGRGEQTAYFLKEGVLGIAGDVELARLVLARWEASPAESLSTLPAYRDVMDRTGPGAPGDSAGLRWFCDPLKLSTWLHTPNPDLQGEDDPQKRAARHGFDAFGGIGGTVRLMAGGADLLQRTAVYAPRPHKSSMRALTFRPGGPFAPPAWIPGDVSSYMTFNLDLARAFDHCGALFDDLYADGIEGTFEGLLEDLRSEDGPRVDVRRDLVMHLGDRIASIDRVTTGGSRAGESNIMALATKDAGRVASAIAALFRDDPGAVPIRIPGHEHPLWKVGEERDGPAEGRDTSVGDDGLGFTSSGVMVAGGHLLIASDYRCVQGLFDEHAGAGPLADARTFKQMTAALNRFGEEDACLRTFSSLARDLRTGYESVRLGKGEDSESIHVRLILKLLSASARSDSEASRVDFTKLPQFEQIKHYLGFAGMVGWNHQNGWILEGVILPSQP